MGVIGGGGQEGSSFIEYGYNKGLTEEERGEKCSGTRNRMCKNTEPREDLLVARTGRSCWSFLRVWGSRGGRRGKRLGEAMGSEAGKVS